MAQQAPPCPATPFAPGMTSSGLPTATTRSEPMARSDARSAATLCSRNAALKGVGRAPKQGCQRERLLGQTHVNMGQTIRMGVLKDDHGSWDASLTCMQPRGRAGGTFVSQRGL